jgi:hypothetical protein
MGMMHVCLQLACSDTALLAILKGREHAGCFLDRLCRNIGTGLNINDVVSAFLRHSQIKLIINVPMPDGNTPLHLSFMRKDHALSQMLLKLGADPACLNARGLKPKDMHDMPIDYVTTYMYQHTCWNPNSRSTATVNRIKHKLR